MYIPKLARDAIPRIWDIHDMPAGAKHILIYFILHMNDQGKEMRPGIPLTIDQTGIKKRTVIKWLGWLVAAGYLIPDGKYGYTDQYQLNLEKLGLVAEAQKPKGLKKTSLEKPPADGQAPGRSVDLKVKQKILSYQRMKKTGSPDAEAWRPTQQELREFIWDYNAMMNRLEPDVTQHELAKLYAEEILRKEEILVG